MDALSSFQGRWNGSDIHTALTDRYHLYAVSWITRKLCTFLLGKLLWGDQIWYKSKGSWDQRKATWSCLILNETTNLSKSAYSEYSLTGSISPGAQAVEFLHDLLPTLLKWRFWEQNLGPSAWKVRALPWRGIISSLRKKLNHKGHIWIKSK